MERSSIEREFFRVLNRLIEPRVRAGWGSPRLVPGGVIVLETKGRRTGRRHRTPLAAIRVQDHTLVSTFRGRRSNWVKNAAADANVRYWLGGRPRPARAFVVAPGVRACGGDGLPAAIRWLVPFLVPYTHAGWAFAVLSPDAAANSRAKRVRRPRPRTMPGRTDGRRVSKGR
jgi:hypothetical protein